MESGIWNLAQTPHCYSVKVLLKGKIDCQDCRHAFKENLFSKEETITFEHILNFMQKSPWLLHFRMKFCNILYKIFQNWCIAHVVVVQCVSHPGGSVRWEPLLHIFQFEETNLSG